MPAIPSMDFLPVHGFGGARVLRTLIVIELVELPLTESASP